MVRRSEQQLSLDDYLKLLGVSFLETGALLSPRMRHASSCLKGWPCTGLSGASLCPGGENVPVTLDNLEEFLEQEGQESQGSARQPSWKRNAW